ncbi:hypothetical protein INS49_007304 [Diaporthe citri]|uniref:uncharacterized protein n=1 Tax=Diaporthe citri TaxID=83186 RepID=UPI001C7E9C85|nr:uncharacterized protein INS49_007304 [Diaporthe citri]KAG6365693.1 hypothetical protein INS49_007304 [Diaporthe citri]
MATETATVDPSDVVTSSSIDLDKAADAHQQQHQHHQRVSPREAQDATTTSPPAETKPFKPTRAFWLVMLSIAVLSLCGSVESTVVVNALPTIVAALGGGNLYLWVPNAFFLASIAVLPLFAQVSDVFGRRNLLLGAASLFVLGCALGGASSSMAMLIVARTIQGIGSGGVDTLTETVILDLVPLRERGKYIALVQIGTTLGYVGGPFVGGLVVVDLGWPWVFYLNVVLSGVALVMFFFFLRVKHRRGQSLWSRIRRLDFGGNAIFIGAVVAVLLAMTWAGPVYQWNSAQIITPLVIGLLGLLAFIAFEWTPRLAPEPSFLRVIVSNRTSAAVLTMTLVNSITMYGTFYFLPVYFQGVLAKSPLNSGIGLAPMSAAVIPFAIVAGTLLSKRRSRSATPQLLSGMYSFFRGFGAIWGVTIPSVIFNNAVKQQVTADPSAFATNPTLAARLADGQAYGLATKAFLDSLGPSDSRLRDHVIAIFEHAIHIVFYALVAFAGLGLLLVFLENEVLMRTENATEFGLEEDGNNKGGVNDSGESAGGLMASADVIRHSNGSGVRSRVVDGIALEEVSR